MIKYLFIFGFLICAVPAYAMPATVDYIYDGDTFAAFAHVSDDISVPIRVRLINIDTPEIHGECDSEISAAFRAKNRLAELIPVGSRVELENIKDDKYLGRIDANVILPDGHDVGMVLIQEKFGRPYSGGRRVGWCANLNNNN